MKDSKILTMLAVVITFMVSIYCWMIDSNWFSAWAFIAVVCCFLYGFLHVREEAKSE